MKEKLLDHLSMFLLWLVTYFQPAGQMLLMVGFLVMADMIMAMLAAHKNSRLPHKLSRSMRITMTKFISYGLVIFVSHILEAQNIIDFPILKVITGYIVFTEIKSLDENFHLLHGVSIFNGILKMLKQKQ